MATLTEEQLALYPEPTAADVVPSYVARYWDLVALADKEPAKVIGEHAKLVDRPGFEGRLCDASVSPNQCKGV